MQTCLKNNFKLKIVSVINLTTAMHPNNSIEFRISVQNCQNISNNIKFVISASIDF